MESPHPFLLYFYRIERGHIMSVNIYDTANQLERELRQTKEYTDLKEAYETVSADEEAGTILKDFQEMQQTIYTKQQMGQEVSEEEIENAQEISKKMTENELTAGLMEKERQLNQVITDINGIIMKPIQEIYQ